MGVYTLGTWIAHKLEQVMWVRYWDSQSLDPRHKRSHPRYVFPKYLEGLLSKRYLVEFWETLPVTDKRRIVGNGKELLDILLKLRGKKLRRSRPADTNALYEKEI